MGVSPKTWGGALRMGGITEDLGGALRMGVSKTWGGSPRTGAGSRSREVGTDPPSEPPDRAVLATMTWNSGLHTDHVFLLVKPPA